MEPIDVDNLVEKTWAEVHKSGEKVDFSTEQKDEIHSLIKTSIANELAMHKSLSALRDNDPPAAVEKLLKKHLHDDRIKMIRDGFTHETFKMKIIEDGVNEPVAKFFRGDKQFMDDIKLRSAEFIFSASSLQMASFVIEMILFVLSLIGIRTSLKEAEMRRLIKDVEPIVREPAVQRMITEFIKKWKTGSAWERAKAIFLFLKDANAAGIFWRLVKLAIREMSWWERIKAIVEIAAMIVAAFATDGVALIAKILLSLDSAVTIVEKVLNIVNLQERHGRAIEGQ